MMEDASKLQRFNVGEASRAFTLIELIVVIAIIIILAGLILSTVGYVQKKGARSRAETEIAAMSAACESYESASLYLYTQLSGTNADRTPITGSKSYFTFKPNQLSPSDQTLPVEFIRDPFGNSYGYSTANQADPAKGYNPTFDLWSTAGLTSDPPTDAITQQWIKNW
jgi:prepilin-type N-terminal cleavage/methylation domain-containing protein